MCAVSRPGGRNKPAMPSLVEPGVPPGEVVLLCLIVRALCHLNMFFQHKTPEPSQFFQQEE